MPGANVIIDLSHFNNNPDFVQAKGDGILAVIHKATQGTGYADPTYAARKEAAEAAGLLWGAYHFGTGADGIEQAQFFLQTVQPSPGDVLVLDFEANGQDPSMTLEEARAFVTHVQSVTGRWPGLYAGAYLKEQLGASTDPVLQNCWFWLSQYGPTAVVPANWPTWTLWQYTDGAAGRPPSQVAVSGRCDRDTFNGSVTDFLTFWTPPATS